MRLKSTLCFLFATAAAAACGSDDSLDTRFEADATGADSTGVSLRLEQPQGRADSLRYTLTNHASHAVHVLRWKTPLERSPEKLFSVSQAGKEVRYIGSYGKRSAAPQDSDYIELAPGGQLSADFDLRENYDLTQGGTYAVRSIVPANVLIAEADWMTVDLDAPVAIEVAAREPRGRRSVATTQQALTYSNCTGDQMNALNAIIWEASRLSADGLFSYRADPWSDRALRWFNDGGWVGANVQGILQAVYDRFVDGDYNLVCDDGHPSCDGFWARAQNWNDVRICAPFWGLSDTGVDSKVDTFLHELTHFAGTGDPAYGLAASYDLARRDQWAASLNADNYAYFYDDAIYP